jgi:serine phosphatase RsbU (regulator of sigma subunit)
MQRLLILLTLLISFAELHSASIIPQDTITLTKLEKEYTLSKGWLYNVNDSDSFAMGSYVDNHWIKHHDSGSKEKLDSIFKKPPFNIWFRLHLHTDYSLHQNIIGLKFVVKDACEVYVDGKKVRTFGTLWSAGEEGESGFNLKAIPIALVLDSGNHVIAVKYSGFNNGGDQRPVQFDVINNISGFEASMITIEQAFINLADTSDTFIFSFFTGIFITLSLFHLILFLFYRSNRTNLYYSLFSLLLFMIFFGLHKITSGSDLYMTTRLGIMLVGSILCVPLLFIALLYQIFYKRILLYFWILAGALLSGTVLMIFSDYQNAGAMLIVLFLIAGILEILRIYYKAWRKKKEGAGIFLFGIMIPPVGTLTLMFIAYVLNSMELNDTSEAIRSSLASFFGYSILLSVSISMTIYLAKDFSRINIKLRQQISEIKQLFQKTISQENERKRILENQNIELERKVAERTFELAQKNRDILDNLQYAQRIQSSILPDIGLIYQTLKDSFIFYRPKDIVSGDFYTFSQKDGKVIIAAADCTGHGVTGAFLSMIGISLLNQIVNEEGITEPAQILNHLNNGIVSSLKQKANDVNDGMDIAICSIDLNERTLQFAGANRPLYIIRNSILEEVKGDKLAIGGFRLNSNASFGSHQINLSEGDCIYIFTDGYADQFGGEKGKKLLSKRLREHLKAIAGLAMKEQERSLVTYFDEWKGSQEQVDDVLMIGIRL